MQKCADCRASEHEDFDDDVRLVVIRDRETNRIVKRAYECSEHISMYMTDGYDVFSHGRNLAELYRA